METLDKVIKTLEDAIDTTDAECPMMTLFEGDATDTLRYLKDYRMLAADVAEKRKELEAEKDRYQEAVKNCEAAENKYRQLSEELRKTSAELSNEPLTWDELREMKGKPVWVEGSAFCEGFWVIPYMFSDSGGSEYFFAQGDQYWREYMKDSDDGVSWQAYRKEVS